MKNFIIPENLVHAIGNYLLSKPMNEVRVLVQELEKIQELKEEPKEKE